MSDGGWFLIDIVTLIVEDNFMDSRRGIIAKQQLFRAQLNLARTPLDQLLAIVSLFPAPGGGWPEDPKSALPPVGTQHQ